MVSRVAVADNRGSPPLEVGRGAPAQAGFYSQNGAG
jgi:hypothetical protein